MYLWPLVRSIGVSSRFAGSLRKVRLALCSKVGSKRLAGGLMVCSCQVVQHMGLELEEVRLQPGHKDLKATEAARGQLLLRGRRKHP